VQFLKNTNSNQKPILLHTTSRNSLACSSGIKLSIRDVNWNFQFVDEYLSLGIYLFICINRFTKYIILVLLMEIKYLFSSLLVLKT